MNREQFEALYSKYREGTITSEEKELLKPYKVDNAIIMAAGYSTRCYPLSKVLPKGLFEVKGEVLIEREIRQLKESGINDICVVVGYLAEAFMYLAEKYGVKIVVNHEYRWKNNVSSIYAVRDQLKNSYICCADNYYTENIFRPYEYETYFCCTYSKEYADEYFIKESGDYITEIKRGGSDGYFTIGAYFWNKEFSSTITGLLLDEYHQKDVEGLLIDDFHIRHLDKLPTASRKFEKDVIFEFDLLSEFADFDSGFNGFFERTMNDRLFAKYDSINRYNGVRTGIRDEGRLHYNENLWGPSPKALEVFKKAEARDICLYDSAEKDILVEEISKKYRIPYDSILLQNSASEAIKSIMNVMLEPGDEVLLPDPYWSYYPGVVDYHFAKMELYEIVEEGDKCRHNVQQIMEKAKEYAPKIMVITSPAMPSGNLIDSKDLEMIISKNPGTLVIVDQAYYGFEDDPTNVSDLITRYDNVVFVRTFSKFYALAGLRMGYIMAGMRAAKALWLDLPLSRLPILSKRAVIAAINDEEYYQEMKKEIKSVKEWFYNELKGMKGLYPYKSDSNFLYIKTEGIDAEAIRERMIEKGFQIRVFPEHGQDYFRINVAPKEIMTDFLEAFKESLKNS